ncbi:hypothetical protein K458DRAFT_299167 [Lentithecium fluviatile CBS 122367]|uniref:MARVEL domain-containing protein n=1 Tax=Lentithecium fluviatile CBS 122367 TaxID=1168545 RepID=A0A6G1J7X9_9PLEO|nr:hypothetical protein K458DRAFT_299167 [Lentithecium fluviatile CBS 122367]
MHPNASETFPDKEKEAFLTPQPFHRPHFSDDISNSHNNSDSVHLLASARSHADARAATYIKQRRQAEARSRPPPRLDSKEYRGYYVTRLALRYLSVLISVAIVAVLLDAIRMYNRSKDRTDAFRNGTGTFRVWPSGLKIWPTMFLLGVAAAAGVLGVILCLASMNAKVRHMTRTGNITTVLISTTCLALWIAVTVYYASWDTKETNWDLLSFACTHSTKEYHYVNVNFQETCTEMRFAIWAAVGLAILEAVNLLVFVVWLVRSKRAQGVVRVMESTSGFLSYGS